MPNEHFAEKTIGQVQSVYCDVDLTTLQPFQPSNDLDVCEFCISSGLSDWILGPSPKRVAVALAIAHLSLTNHRTTRTTIKTPSSFLSI